MFIHTDNIAARVIINKGTCRNRAVMDSLRRIFWPSSIFNFHLKCVYYPEERDKLGDATSRLHEPNRFAILKTAMFKCGYF